MNVVATAAVAVAAIVVVSAVLVLVTRAHYRAWRFGLFFESEDRITRAHDDDTSDGPA